MEMRYEHLAMHRLSGTKQILDISKLQTMKKLLVFFHNQMDKLILYALGSG